MIRKEIMLDEYMYIYFLNYYNNLNVIQRDYFLRIRIYINCKHLNKVIYHSSIYDKFYNEHNFENGKKKVYILKTHK